MSAAAARRSDSGSAAELEEQYVHLNTQLLLQLQRSDVLAALNTAEAIRALCLASSEGITENPVQASTLGSQLFDNSPAAALLGMRGALTTSSLLQKNAPLQTTEPVEEEDAFHPLSRTPATTTPTASEMHEGSVTSDDDSTVSSADSSLPSTSDSDINDNNSSSSSSSNNDHSSNEFAEAGGRRQNQITLSDIPQQPFSSLADALTKWSRLPLVAATPENALRPARKPAPPSRTSLTTGSVAEANTSTTLPQTHAPEPPCFAPSPPLTAPQRPHQTRRRPDSLIDKAKESIVLTSAAADAATEAENASSVDDCEADETWERMQQQVAKEMERLAVVRKHR